MYSKQKFGVYLVLTCAVVIKGHTESFINYDLDFLQRSGQRGLGPWGTSQPNNAYDDLPLLQKPVLGHETRLDLITQDSLFHPSLGRGYAPTDLRNSDYMITMDTLRSRFGASWNPKFVELSAFEGKCKKEWGIFVSTMYAHISEKGVLILITEECTIYFI